MSDFWKVLGINPTTDITAIKQAYAALAKKYHPEEFPEEFLNLRGAYESAMDYAAAATESFFILPDDEDTEESSQEQGFEEEVRSPEEPIFWDLSKLSDKNDVDCTAALSQFLDLYKSKNNKDANKWYTYFTSYNFLEVWREEKFTEKLYIAVLENKEQFPVNKTFAKCLNAVYGCSVSHPDSFDVVQYSRNVFFDGFSNIEKILSLCGNLGRMTQNDLSMFISFCEYRILVSFAEENQWSDSIKISAEYIFYRYVMTYLRERCEKREYSDVERYYLGIRLMTNFVKKYELPEDMYLYLWKNYSLESAVTGRNKIYYGQLREIISEKVQIDAHGKKEIVSSAEKKPEQRLVESNKKVYDSYYAYQKSLAENKWDSRVVENFFSLPETERMLKDRHFIYDTLFYWIAMPQHLEFLERLYDFYGQNPEVYKAKEILMHLEKRKKETAVENALKEDEADKNAALCTISHRPFLRYWLNIGFYRAVNFSGVLKENLIFSEKWAKDFAEREHRLFLFTYRNKSVEIEFHRRYAEYYYGGKAIHKPFIQWYGVENIEDDTLFFLLLPTVIPFIDDKKMYHMVLDRVRSHLKNTSLTEEITAQLSRGIVKMLFCGRYILKEIDDEDEEFYYDCNEYAFYGENETNLYVCTWSKYSHLLCFYEQKKYEKVFMTNGVYDNILTEEAAHSLAKELLSAQCSKTVADIRNLRIMPEYLYIQPYGAKKEIRSGEEITEDFLVDALDRFAKNKIRRLEMNWIQEELVLINTGEWCGCFWFFDGKYTMCKLLSKPDVYCTTDSKYVTRVPFLYGKLANYELFHSPRWLIMKLCPLFFQFGEGKMIDTRVNGGYVWSQNVYLYGKYDAYLVDKMKFGGFDPERVITDKNIKRKIIIPKFPAFIEVIQPNREKQRIDIKPPTKDQLQMYLQMYLQGNVNCLHLCWERKEQENALRAHIFLLQENQNYALYYMSDETNAVYSLIGNLSEYILPEGESPIVNLCGVPMHHYIVHEDLIRLRFFLSLLLDSIEAPQFILKQTEAFTDGKRLYGQPMTYGEFYEKFCAIG